MFVKQVLWLLRTNESHWKDIPNCLGKTGEEDNDDWWVIVNFTLLLLFF